eukprot:CAMPEP_0197192578 /NCGR_PEP_ID=MMETSP1423-20130617/25257_1 /TAXON_ID=476441 /ORGANISM="Pseudo-nitzschia heimii, Strain UNC1101" /LENGTH=190 /DNA_ID=CAMNT_0042645485 /DNA_START=78 /DNA_END=647 /DNA_ORIENTATION=-
MDFNTSLTSIKPEEIYDIDKSGESTETLDTTEMSVSSEDQFDEYKEMVDNFNNRMLSGSDQQHNERNPTVDDTNANSIKMQSTLPSDIAKYKTEIWYPECRDCACCQGFKYGCRCAPSNNGICMCITGVPDDVSIVSMYSHEYRNDQLQCTILPLESQPRRNSKRNLYRDKRKVNAPCRFFFSATGCRQG